MDSRVFYTTLDSPVGALFLTSNGEAITELFMEKHKGGPKPIGDWRRDGLFREAADQLQAYFAGELTEFDLPLATGGAPFQQRVWAELKIPYGSTISYGELARRIDPKSSARGRRGERQQPDLDHHSLSPLDRVERQADRLRRRHRAQEIPD